MFSFFKKSKPHDSVNDKVVIDTAAKFSNLLALWQQDKQLVIICWFEESLQQLQDFFIKHTTEPVNLWLAREVNSQQVSGKPVVFAEHYPLHHREILVFERLNLQPAIVYTSLDEHLLLLFGGERISKMMRLMGYKENELISHPMISSSIRKAQDKLASRVSFEQTAHSAADWFKLNLPASNP